MSGRGKNSRFAVFAAAVVILLFVGAAPARSADLEFTATVDRTVLDRSETVTLTLQVDGSVSSVKDPKLPDFNGFRIVSGPNESSTFQYINGKYTFIKTWTFILKPLKTGTLQIGAAEIEHKGQTYRTDPIVLQVGGQGAPVEPRTEAVTPQPDDGKEPAELYVTVTADKTKLYQSEQVILTYTIYTRVSVNAYEISRLPSTPGFWTEEFQLAQQPAVQDAVIKGRHYRKAVIRKVALFPTRSGKLTVDPLEVTCQVQVQQKQSRRRDPFDRLFDSPFSRYRTEERFIETVALQFQVLPLPERGKPNGFSGAVGQFDLDVTLDRQQVKANEALSMTARFSGTGNIKLLPAPNFVVPPDFEAYEPKESSKLNKSGQRIVGSKTFEYVLIPRVAGTSELPAVTFSYFDPVSKTYKRLIKGGFEITVEKSDNGGVASMPGLSKEDVKLLAEDIRYLKPVGRLARIGSPNQIPASYWIGITLPPVLLMALWWGARLLGAPSLQARRKQRKSYARAVRQLQILVRSSGHGEDASQYSSVHRILMEYLGEKLGLSASGLKEEEVLHRLEKRQISEDVLAAVNDVFQSCNLARFAPEGQDDEEFSRILKQCSRALDQIEKIWEKPS
jgi:hypothetical protein